MDLKLKLRSTYFGNIHDGFLENFWLVMPVIIAAIKDSHSYTYNIVGHSLGAAVAVLVAYELRVLYSYAVNVYPIGM